MKENCLNKKNNQFSFISGETLCIYLGKTLNKYIFKTTRDDTSHMFDNATRLTTQEKKTLLEKIFYGELLTNESLKLCICKNIIMLVVKFDNKKIGKSLVVADNAKAYTDMCTNDT